MISAAVIVPHVAQTDWLRGILPSGSVAELPLAGRNFADYAIECLGKLNIARAAIVDASPSPRLAAYFGEGTRTRTPVDYVLARECGCAALPPRGLADLKDYLARFAAGHPGTVSVTWGIGIPQNDPDENETEEVSEADLADTPPGFYRLVDGKVLRVRTECLFVRDVASWHAANLELLHNPRIYTLPGYSAEKGIHLGRNVVMERGTEVKGPVVIDSNVWCARNVRIDGDVIVNSGSFIGEGACLARTVVGHDTYIGKGLELRDKIVVGRRIIDAKTGTWTDADDAGVAQQIGVSRPGVVRRLYRFLCGASRGRRG